MAFFDKDAKNMKLEERAKARELRSHGFSIKQVADVLNVSKGSISAWVRDINLSKEALLSIDKRLQLGRERSRQSRLANISRSRKELFEQCKAQILPLSHRDLWIAGLMLYAGEGRKVWDVSSQPIELTSSEPNILRIFINFLTEVCNVPIAKIKVRLFLYPDIDLKETENFWSRELKIPLNQFQKAYIKQSYSNPIRSRRSEYGTAHVILSNAELYRKILGWLQAIYDIHS